jgi:RNase P subunit RPR2
MEQILKIKCPHCGWIRRLDVQAYEDSGITSVTRDIKDELRKAVENVRSMLTNDSLADANGWIDMPACSNCDKTYRYNVKTREVQP